MIFPGINDQAKYKPIEDKKPTITLPQVQESDGTKVAEKKEAVKAPVLPEASKKSEKDHKKDEKKEQDAKDQPKDEKP